VNPSEIDVLKPKEMRKFCCECPTVKFFPVRSRARAREYETTRELRILIDELRHEGQNAKADTAKDGNEKAGQEATQEKAVSGAP
jgi:hypothetical protein